MLWQSCLRASPRRLLPGDAHGLATWLPATYGGELQLRDSAGL